LVVTIHDLFPLRHPDEYTSSGVRAVGKLVERAKSEADLVCCPSKATLEECVAAGFDAAKLRHVPWGVPQREVPVADREAVRRRYRLPRPFILWIGTVEPRKNLPTLLEAFRAAAQGEAAFGDIDLVLVGDIDWQQQVAGHTEGVATQVRQLGFVPAADLAALSAEAELLAVPSSEEGFGLSTLSAMVQGAPVVCSRDTAISEVVGDAGVALDAHDVEAWAETLTALMLDSARRKELSELAEERAGEYSWERAAQAMVDVYIEAIGAG
jgi:glycosyltransferase involved in cell wall biosynthesis